MKPIKIILGILLSSLILVSSYFAYNLFINPISPRESVKYKSEGKEISISYYRPYKKERLIFGEAADGALVPYGKYWRLGANLTTKNLILAYLKNPLMTIKIISIKSKTKPRKNNTTITTNKSTLGSSKLRKKCSIYSSPPKERKVSASN